MVLVALVQALGWLLAKSPEGLLRGLCALSGWLIYRCTSRGRIILDNLHHAFPDRPLDWHRRLAQTNAARTVELFLLPVALPFLSAARRRRLLAVDAATREVVERLRGVRGVVCAPHSTLVEAFVLLPEVFPEVGPTADFFRPFNHRALDAWMARQRERHGLTLISRKDGVMAAKRFLDARGNVAVLYDQYVYRGGLLALLCGRVTHTTELAGILAKRAGSEAIFLTVHREGFWRGRLVAQALPRDEDPATLTLAANRALEGWLKASEANTASWFWMHRRWKYPRGAYPPFALPRDRKNVLERDLRERRLTAVPRGFRAYLWWPCAPERFAELLPLLERWAASRPDAELNLLMPAHVGPPLRTEGSGPLRSILCVPEERRRARECLRQLSWQFPDQLAVLEADPAPARLRLLGRLRANQVLTYGFRPDAQDRTRPYALLPAPLKSAPEPDQWEAFMEHFGLPPEGPKGDAEG